MELERPQATASGRDSRDAQCKSEKQTSSVPRPSLLLEIKDVKDSFAGG